mmetsp:Transcript_28298/g.73181  ORF Transcript_28298/g.73181 Transcript_28298/m.73181 type:complete len:254 (+) Transcript_28298:939-1700(+)
MERHPADCCTVPAVGFLHLEITSLHRIDGVHCGKERIAAILRRPRGVRFSSPRSSLIPQHVDFSLLLSLPFVLVQLLLQRIHLGHVAIFFKPHQHLLLHCNFIFVPQLCQRWLVLLIVTLQPPQVDEQFVLLLHNSPVVHTMKVPLLAELVPRPSCNLGHCASLLQLLLQHGDVLVQALVPRVNVRDHLNVLTPKPAGGLQLIPLGLECLERLLHIMLDEKIPDEIIDHGGALRNRGSYSSVFGGLLGGPGIN